jgi:Ran GTPase-activating protein (RanGAP) involved in mRNA processing and transport
MSHNEFTNHSLGLLAEGLKENTILTDFFLSHNDLSHPNGMKIIEMLGNKSALKSLALNNCKLNSDLLSALYESLKDNDSLKELYVYSNSIGAAESKHVANIIQNKRKMTSLGLSNN